MPSAIAAEVEQSIRRAEYIEIFHDPGHADLPAHLKGADILVIAESFDQEVVDGYGLSISSKAHLFMFSERPILIYAPATTGLARYATEEGWAEVVCSRDPSRLSCVIKGILSSPERQQALIQQARRIGEANHDATANRALFAENLSGKRSEAGGVNASVRKQ
jgi:glycosyltransferase involved in cell wall biosynthesis